MPMKPEQVKTVADAKKIVEERGLTHIKVGAFDGDAILRGKYMSKAKFFSALDNGFGFCDVVLVGTATTSFFDNVKYTGWHTAYPDAPVKVIPSTCRELPFEDNGLLFLAEFTDRAEAICPRGTLRRVLDRAAKMGFDVYSSLEFEFFMFDETPESIREKNYKEPHPDDARLVRLFRHPQFGLVRALPGNPRHVREDAHADRGLHTERPARRLEAALTYDKALEAADRGALFKTFMKVLAQRRGLMATFAGEMVEQLPGQSGHIHISLKGKDGKNAFHDPKKPPQRLRQMRWFIGGQQTLMPEVLGMVASTVNSIRASFPASGRRPTQPGVENRTCAPRHSRIGEIAAGRISDRAADCNPYLALAASIGSGLYGIEHKIEPTAPIVGNSTT